MNEQQLATFENYAKIFYQPPSSDAHKEAMGALSCFQENPEYTAQLKFVLDNSSEELAQLYAASCLNVLAQWHWTSFSMPTRVDIRNYILNFLARNGPNVHEFLVNELIKLLARITKLGWFDGDDPIHRKTPQDVTAFFQPESPRHSEIGLKILIQLVVEICQASVQHTIGQHRKTAVSFRDTALLRVFKLSLQTLRAINSNTVTEAEATMKDELKMKALKLAHLCIAYDFVGTQPSESTEDEGTCKIPTDWRPLFQDPSDLRQTSLLDLFWDMYFKSQAPANTKAMEILVELASVRRSLFSEEEAREAHLGRIMNGITDVLRTREGLEVQETFHQFCRLLARLKSNYQLSQIVNAEGYLDWIRLVSKFSVSSLQQWSYSPNSIYYILSLWSRLVSAIPYLHSNSPSLLEEYAPQLFEAYLASRMESVDQCIEMGIEDPFDEENESLFVQLDVLPYIGRLRYDSTMQLINQQFDPLAQRYERMQAGGGLMSGNVTPEQMASVEGKLSWLTYIIGAIVSEPSCSIVANAVNAGRVTTNSSEEHSQIDAELSSRVLKLLDLHNTSLEMIHPNYTDSKLRLELALLSFLQDFRKVYVGDTSIGSVQMFERLKEIMGVGESNMVLSVMVSKLLLNFKCMGDRSEVIRESIELFYDLAAGYSSIRLLTQLPEMEAMLLSHTSQTFPFLDYPDNQRARVKYYTTLAKVLLMLDNHKLRRQFFYPFQQVFEELLARDTPEAFRADECRQMLVNVLLDLRGILIGVYSRVGYEWLFNVLYPRYLPVIERTAEVWYDNHKVSLAMLKFVQEFTVNKSGRITFDMSSANGILLFKETSKILCSYGRMVATLPVQQLQDPYKEKYKGISLCLKILCNGLQGNYCNFGVFALYGDTSLSDGIDTCLKLVLEIPVVDIMQYPKLTASYFAFIDRIFDHQIPSLLRLNPDALSQIVLTLQEGLRYSEVGVSTQCCNCLDHLASYWFKKRSEPEEGSDDPAKRARDQEECAAIERQSAVLGGTLQSLLAYVLFEDCPNQWSCSRAVFSLTLLCPDAFQGFKQRLLDRQPPEAAEKLNACYEALMKDVTEDLESKVRDTFTRQLNNFRTSIREFVTTDVSI